MAVDVGVKLEPKQIGLFKGKVIVGLSLIVMVLIIESAAHCAPYTAGLKFNFSLTA